MEGHDDEPLLPRRRDRQEMLVGDNFGVIEGDDYNPNDCKPKGGEGERDDESREDMDEENDDTESNPGDEFEKRLKI